MGKLSPSVHIILEISYQFRGSFDELAVVQG
jgi:hypothetical protein